VTVHPHGALPTAPARLGNGRRPQPRYRDKPSPVTALPNRHGRQAFTEVTWRAKRLAQTAALTEHGCWDGVLPEATVPAERAAGAEAPTDYWVSNLPAGTQIAGLVRLAKIRRRIEHDYRQLKHGLGLDHFEGRSRTGWHHHVTLVTAAHVSLTASDWRQRPIHRPHPLPDPRHHPRPD